MDRKHDKIHNLLAEAANVIRKEKIATGKIEPAEGYKGGQIKALKEFANFHGLWIDLDSFSFSLSFLSKGGENEVFTTGKEDIVFKLNNFEYAGDDLENFFIRMDAHNRLFSNVPYQMAGFAYNSQQEFCAVLEQPYVRAEREATEEEIQDFMAALGFEMDYTDEYHNERYEIFDVVPNNVLYGIDGELYFIDTQIRLREKQSPYTSPPA